MSGEISLNVDFKNVLFPTLEPAMPKLPNTLSKGYLESVV